MALHMRRWALALLVGCCMLLLGSVVAMGQIGRSELPPDLATLEADVELLTAFHQMDLTGSQARVAADLLDEYAAATEPLQGELVTKVTDSRLLLERMRELLLAGETVDGEAKAAYSAIVRSTRQLRAALARHRNAFAERLAGLLTDGQKSVLREQLRDGASRASARPRENPAQRFLLTVRQWSDDAYAERRTDLAKRVVGKNASADRVAEAADFLDRVRALSAEEYEERLQDLDKRLHELAGAGLERRTAARPPGPRRDVQGDEGPFGAVGEAQRDSSPRALATAALLMRVRRLDDATYAQRRDQFVKRLAGRTGAGPEVAERVGKILDDVRALPDDQLRAKLPAAAEELLKLAGQNREPVSAQGPGRDIGGIAVRGLVERMLAGDPRHVAMLLREYAVNAEEGAG